MFITLTHASGRALINIEHIIGVVEHDGKVYVVPRPNGDTLEVFETYDDIMNRIESSKGKVW
jgi:hypothetical protein